MAGHRLGGAEDELLGPVAEHGLHGRGLRGVAVRRRGPVGVDVADLTGLDPPVAQDRKSTRLNSSHGYISYAVFCLKKKKKDNDPNPVRKAERRAKNRTRDHVQ